jgi:hypothetical protein
MPTCRYPDIGPPISGYSLLLIFGALLHNKLYLIEIGFALTAARDFDETCRLQFLDEFAHSGLAHAHVRGQALLTGEATVIVPGIVQKHRVRYFSTEAELAVFKNEIRDLCKATANNRIIRGELDVALA